MYVQEAGCSSASRFLWSGLFILNSLSSHYWDVLNNFLYQNITSNRNTNIAMDVGRRYTAVLSSSK